MRLHFTSVLLYHFFSVSKSSSDPFNMHSRLCKLVKILIVCTNVYIISLNEKIAFAGQPAPVLCQLDNIKNLNFSLCIKTKDSCITLARYTKQNFWSIVNVYLTYNAQAEIQILNVFYCQFLKYTYSSYWPPLAGTPPSPSTYFLFFLNVVFIEIASVWKKWLICSL